MADTKISNLVELAAGDIASDDAFPIADTSAAQTKKVTFATFDLRYLNVNEVAAKGDLFVGTADDVVGIQAVGANDTMLMADSATGTGQKWATPSVVRTALGLGNAALMTVDADLPTLSVPANTTISTYGATLVDDADAAAARTTLGLLALATKAAIAVPGDITATGTPSSTTFLRGDGQWATPAGGGGGLTEAQVRTRSYLRC